MPDKLQDPLALAGRVLLLFKNIAVSGGLLTFAAWGPGAWSLDARRTR
jgi:uncharacterized membrane protein YphA (DoxX/SURF4 family)